MVVGFADRNWMAAEAGESVETGKQSLMTVEAEKQSLTFVGAADRKTVVGQGEQSPTNADRKLMLVETVDQNRQIVGAGGANPKVDGGLLAKAGRRLRLLIETRW